MIIVQLPLQHELKLWQQATTTWLHHIKEQNLVPQASKLVPAAAQERTASSQPTQQLRGYLPTVLTWSDYAKETLPPQSSFLPAFAG